MKSLSSIGLGLSIIFGFLLLALVAELYYLFWWKKRFTRPDFESEYSNPANKELFFILCCKNPSSSSALNPKPTQTLIEELNPGNNEDLLFQPFHDYANLGPGLNPRFLFTIIEETKEDLESEDGLSVKGKCLSDLFLTPTASPSLFPPLTPSLMESPHSCPKNKKGALYSLFESSTDAEFNRIIRSSSSSSSSSSSPPPRLKFLRDAEEKLYRSRLMEMEEAQRLTDKGFVQETVEVKSFASKSSLDQEKEEIGSFVRIIVDANKEKGFIFQHHQHEEPLQFQSSSSSQVLPLAASPSSIRRHSCENVG